MHSLCYLSSHRTVCRIDHSPVTFHNLLESQHCRIRTTATAQFQPAALSLAMKSRHLVFSDMNPTMSPLSSMPRHCSQPCSLQILLVCRAHRLQLRPSSNATPRSHATQLLHLLGHGTQPHPHTPAKSHHLSIRHGARFDSCKREKVKIFLSVAASTAKHSKNTNVKISVLFSGGHQPVKTLRHAN